MPGMFAFDKAALPRLTTSKALILVDFQNDFISDDGALPVTQPEGFVKRAIGLATAFREVGEVVWVTSQFEANRLYSNEQIITGTDSASADKTLSSRPSPMSRPSAKILRGLKKIQQAEEPQPSDPEAFLSQDKQTCVLSTSIGSEMYPSVAAVVEAKDAVLVKSEYSAFVGTPLLRALRSKLVMEVLICGSLANVGVYATALDAAGHGMSITIVEDCCGYREEIRQIRAIEHLIELTGCEIATCEEVCELLSLQQPSTSPVPSTSPDQSELAQVRNPISPPPANLSNRLSTSPDIVGPMTSLRLLSGSPPPLAIVGDASSGRPIRPTETAKLASATEPSESDLQSPINVIQPTLKPEIVVADQSDELHKIIAQPDSEELLESTEGKESSQIEETSDRATHNSLTPIKAAKDGESQARISEGENIDNELFTEKATTPADTQDKFKRQEGNKQGCDKREGDQTKREEVESENVEGHSIARSIRTSAKAEDEVQQQDDEVPSSAKQRNLYASDTEVIKNLLPSALEATIFDRLRDGIQWQRMSHQGGQVPRLVAVQGDVGDDGSIPIYRHPADESPPLLPFSEAVLAIKTETEKHLGHPLNHALIQFYRDGKDYISEHSDKTLDIVPGSYIANVSLGAQRTMVLRTKREAKHTPEEDALVKPKRETQRALLPHNSLCKMGPKTNEEWLHAIRQDKRADRDKTSAELAFQGGRISLTFRHIGTFLSKDEDLIWGQGATNKLQEDAQPVVNGQTSESVEMLRAFGIENQSSIFDWKAYYGKGFDVLHISSSPRLFTSGDFSESMNVRFMLAEQGIGYAKGSFSPSSAPAEAKEKSATAKSSGAGSNSSRIRFVDNRNSQAAVEGHIAILLYLDARQRQSQGNNPANSLDHLGKQLTLFQKTLELSQKYSCCGRSETQKLTKEIFRDDLAEWDIHAGAEQDGDFIAGSQLSLPDFVLWPVLYMLSRSIGDDIFDGLKDLQCYYDAVYRKDSVKQILGDDWVEKKA